jgi:hypothetical protein
MKRGEVAEELNDEGKGAEGYTKWRGCRRVIRRWERLVEGYMKRGEVAEESYEGGEVGEGLQGYRVQRGLLGSALACCKAGPSSNLGSAAHGGSAH